MALKIIDEAKRLVQGEIDPARICRGDYLDYDATVAAFKAPLGIPFLVWRDWTPKNPAGKVIYWVADSERQRIELLMHISNGATDIWDAIQSGELAGIDLAMTDVVFVQTPQGNKLTSFQIQGIGLLRAEEMQGERRAQQGGAGE